MIRVMIVSKHAGERARLAAVLAQWPDFEVPAPCKDSYDALYAARSFPPHVALVDEEPSLLDCPELVSALRRWSPRTKVIVLASSPDSRAVLKSIASGAAGYLLKGRDADLVPAVDWVHRGGTLMTEETASRAFGRLPSGKAPRAESGEARGPDITRTELGLLTRIGRGLSNKEIAAELCLKDNTVRNYVSRLLKKTGLRSRTEIALFAHRAGLLDGEWKGGVPGPPLPPAPAAEE
jgi:DNA-binding NarL/FixJ family response regulator